MFDIHQPIFDEEYGELDERRMCEYIDAVESEFQASPEALKVREKFGDRGWLQLMLEYAFQYIGVTIPQMSLHDFDEIVFELFPKKISTRADSAESIIEEFKAFWQFIHRQYGLSNARQIGDTLTSSAVVRLRRELSNPRNFGMAKSLAMAAIDAGCDLSDQEQMDRFVIEYNRRLLQARQSSDQYYEAPLPSHIEPEVRSRPESSARERFERRRKQRRAERKHGRK